MRLQQRLARKRPHETRRPVRAILHDAMQPDMFFGILLAVFLTWRLVERLRSRPNDYAADGTRDVSSDASESEDDS